MQEPQDKPHHANTVHYTNSSIQRLIRLVTILFACLLPVASIVILYVVTNQPVRLGIVAVLVTLFSLLLGLFTSSHISDIFAATSTYVHPPKKSLDDYSYLCQSQICCCTGSFYWYN